MANSSREFNNYSSSNTNSNFNNSKESGRHNEGGAKNDPSAAVDSARSSGASVKGSQEGNLKSKLRSFLTDNEAPVMATAVDSECRAKYGFFGMKGPDGSSISGAGDERLIMSPPVYSDLGKKAKDIFNKGYHFGLLKLDCRTKTDSGVEFNTGGTSNQESGKVFGSLETKYKVKEYGITFSERWNTDNTLGTEISIQDQLLQGLKLSGEINFSPQTGDKKAVVKSQYLHERVALTCDVNVKDIHPLLSASVVVGHQGWLAGYQAAFDTNNNKLTKSNFALGFSTGDFILHTTVGSSDDGQEFGGAIYQKISPKLETGIQLAWSAGSNDTKFGIGAKYDLDRDASLRAKVNNASQIGLGYQQRLRPGVTLTLSALIDGKNFNAGGHKVGLALELEA